jgi:hypothetical protein
MSRASSAGSEQQPRSRWASRSRAGSRAIDRACQLWTRSTCAPKCRARLGGVDHAHGARVLVDREPRFVGNAEIKSDTLALALIEEDRAVPAPGAARAPTSAQGYARGYFSSRSPASRAAARESERVAPDDLEIRRGLKASESCYAATPMPDTRFLPVAGFALAKRRSRGRDSTGRLGLRAGGARRGPARDAQRVSDRGWKRRVDRA